MGLFATPPPGTAVYEGTVARLTTSGIVADGGNTGLHRVAYQYFVSTEVVAVVFKWRIVDRKHQFFASATPTGGGLFGGLSAAASAKHTGGGLFGGLSAPWTPTGGGLFGGSPCSGECDGWCICAV